MSLIWSSLTVLPKAGILPFPSPMACEKSASDCFLHFAGAQIAEAKFLPHRRLAGTVCAVTDGTLCFEQRRAICWAALGLGNFRGEHKSEHRYERNASMRLIASGAMCWALPATRGSPGPIPPRLSSDPEQARAHRNDSNSLTVRHSLAFRVSK
jgi:hypothetical protein